MIPTKYDKNYTFLYIFFHIFIGILLSIDTIPIVYRAVLFIMILVYQLGQLAINKRYFVWTNTLKNGNSVAHTFNKLLHHIVGYVIGRLLITRTSIL